MSIVFKSVCGSLTAAAALPLLTCSTNDRVTLATQSVLAAIFHVITVNPFMFTCPLFREFRELNETAKLKGVNIDTVATSIGITHVLE